MLAAVRLPRPSPEILILVSTISGRCVDSADTDIMECLEYCLDFFFACKLCSYRGTTKDKLWCRHDATDSVEGKQRFWCLNNSIALETQTSVFIM